MDAEPQPGDLAGEPRPGGTAEPPDVDALVERLRARVAERRAAGDYPDGLEERLDAHFARIAAHRADEPFDFEDLRNRLMVLDAQMAFSRARIPIETQVPGGEFVHRAIGKVVSRQVQGVLEQMHEFADGVRGILRQIVAALEDPNSHLHADVVGQLDAVFERLREYERWPADDRIAVSDLRERVEALEAAESARRFRPWYPNERFEEAFRGTRDEMLQRYRDVAAGLVGYDPVVDIGCGRGEFLDLLRENGVEAIGLEIDDELVRAGVERGLSVESGDAVEWLSRRDDDSLGAIVLIQVIEHLTRQQVLDFVLVAREKLRPGGKVVIETVNPQSLYVFAHAFYLDPTHDNPVHPAYLSFLFREAGYNEVGIEWRSPPDEADALVAPEHDGSGISATNVERLNRLLFAPQDYLLVATR